MAKTAVLIKIVLLIGAFMVISNVGHSDTRLNETPIPDDISTKNIELAQHAFRMYNPSIFDSTILNFIRISKAYGLSRDQDVFRKCVSQICLESRAKQSAISSGNAMGMGQIVPTTAFDVLHKLTADDRAKMASLGATSTIWALHGKYIVVEDSVQGRRLVLSSALRTKTISWLKNENNNLVLWAHIMSRRSAKKGFDKALLYYKMGEGAASKYTGSPREHPYIKKIYLISKKLSEKKKGVN